MRIGILGGTGKEGRGLAARWARAGHEVLLGSRDATRAGEVAARLAAAPGAGEVAARLAAAPGAAEVAAGLAVPSPRRGEGRVGGADNRSAARCDVVVVSVPYPAHAPLLTELRDELAGRIVVDLVVPIVPPAVDRVSLPADQAAALEARRILGPDSRIVAALHHVSSVHLADPDHAIDCDVLMCGDDDAAIETVTGLVADLGMRGLHAGPLANAVALEAMTPVLLHLNKRHRTRGLGLRITGLP